MQSNQARLFIAVPIPAEVKQILLQWSRNLQEKLTFKRWLHPDDYHITLKFIGECDVAKIPIIHNKLHSISLEQPSFYLKLDTLHCFNNTQSTKILWAGVQGDLKILHQLQREVELSMEQIGFPMEGRPYRPHISIARNSLQGIISEQILTSFATYHQSKQEVTWKVEEIVLYKTHLGKSPSYEPIANFPFHTP